MAKRLWKIAMEYHTFFRMKEPTTVSKGFPRVGSKYHFPGRTYHQACQDSGHADRVPPNFRRSQSERPVGQRPQDGVSAISTERIESYHPGDSKSATLDLKGGKRKSGLPMADRVDGHYDSYNNDPDENVCLYGGTDSRVFYARAGTLEQRPGYRPHGAESMAYQTGAYAPVAMEDGVKSPYNASGNAYDALGPYDTAGRDSSYYTGGNMSPYDSSGMRSPYDTMGNASEDIRYQFGPDGTLRSDLHPGTGEPQYASITKKNVTVTMTGPPAVPPRFTSSHGVGYDESALPPYQEDQLAMHGRYGQGGGEGSWNSPSHTSTPQRGSAVNRTTIIPVGSQGPTVPTERVKYESGVPSRKSTTDVPFVKTETRTVTYSNPGVDESGDPGTLVSAQAHSSRTQTIETTTYKTEKDGVTETRVERKVVISSMDDDIDHDLALAEAIKSVTDMNPDLSVEKIEIQTRVESEA